MNYDVIIIGGSYAGLSAAMALGRSLRRVLVIDNGRPCNRNTPHSHNFLTRDGETPASLANISRQQVLQYDTVEIITDTVIKAARVGEISGFEVQTASNKIFRAVKLILANGIKDQLLPVPGFEECWGITLIHCPYCHGYEVRNKPTGIVANGEAAMHYAQLLTNLTRDLIIFTNGSPDFTAEQQILLEKHHIQIHEKKIESIIHDQGFLSAVQLANGETVPRQALYFRPPFIHSGNIYEELGCAVTEHGYIQVNAMQETSASCVYACGDNCSPMRSVANAVAAGNMAGAAVNASLCRERFN